jgi:multidrug efflux system membrane fusion protein
VKSDQAAIESAKLQLDYAHITAPLDGVTGIRLVDPGNVVHAADPTGLVVITPLDPIAVILTLPEDDLPQIAQGMADGALTVQALSRDGSVHLGEGEVTVLDNQINQATASLRLKAVFPNPKHLLWPNQFVKTRVLLQTRKNALVVASSAIQRGPQGTFIYVVDPNQTVSVKPVEVELVQDEVALLSNGLEGGETVVLDGQDQLKAGSKVAPRGSGHSETSRAGRTSEAGPTR